jgi:hypothetical protein
MPTVPVPSLRSPVPILCSPCRPQPSATWVLDSGDKSPKRVGIARNFLTLDPPSQLFPRSNSPPPHSFFFFNYRGGYICVLARTARHVGL